MDSLINLHEDFGEVSVQRSWTYMARTDDSAIPMAHHDIVAVFEAVRA